MQEMEFLRLSLFPWSQWSAPAAGLTTAVLVFLIAHGLTRRRPARDQDTVLPPDLLSDPPTDPFHQGASLDPLSNPPTDPFHQGASLERRNALRRRGNEIAVIISDDPVAQKPARGWVVDRSINGMCLAVEKACTIGSVLSIRSASAPEMPWVQLVVKNCRGESCHDWRLGCQFVRTPPWNVLLLFG